MHSPIHGRFQGGIATSVPAQLGIDLEHDALDVKGLEDCGLLSGVNARRGNAEFAVAHALDLRVPDRVVVGPLEHDDETCRLVISRYVLHKALEVALQVTSVGDELHVRLRHLDPFLPAYGLHLLTETVHIRLDEERICHKDPPRNELLDWAEERREAVVPLAAFLEPHKLPGRGLDSRRLKNPCVIDNNHVARQLQLERFNHRVLIEPRHLMFQPVDQLEALPWLLARLENHLLGFMGVHLVLALSRRKLSVQQVVVARLLLGPRPDDGHLWQEIDVVRVAEVVCHPRRRADLVQDVVDFHFAVLLLRERLEPLSYFVHLRRLVRVLVVQLREGEQDGVQVDGLGPHASVLLLGNVTQLALQPLAVLVEERHVPRTQQPPPRLVECQPLHRFGLPLLPLALLVCVREGDFELQLY
mmetsp:Transcript_18001/g.36287  ORF Transcript_18001/g.36287 Transcript_18001/m.36287 type:complete len:416 (+) Transcript_18001:508-1755(+)